VSALLLGRRPASAVEQQRGRRRLSLACNCCRVTLINEVLFRGVASLVVIVIVAVVPEDSVTLLMLLRRLLVCNPQRTTKQSRLTVEIQLAVKTSTNSLWIRNCNSFSEPMTSHALVRLVDSRWTLLHH